MKKLHRQPLTLILALIMLFATSLSSVTAVGADTPITASISLQSVPPNGIDSTIADVFPDPGLAAAVAEELGRGVNSIVSASELGSITYLWDGNRNIESIEGVQYFTGLEYLYLENNQISNITPLAGLTNLQELELYNNQISDIAPLAGLTGLEWLSLYNNQISDITPLAGLTNLLDLVLPNNQISDVSPLAELTNLQELYLNYNQVYDITPIAGLTGLEWLNLSYNQINDISPLAELTNLRELNLSSQAITLNDAIINTSTKFVVKEINADPVDLTLLNDGTYEDGSLTWTNTGDNQATWTSSVTIGRATATFGGRVSQYAAENISEIVTVEHILAVRDHILGKTPLPANERTMMDVNKDGVINIFDMLVMRDMILRRRINAECRIAF
ncbi:MAG: leucine-rich repeat domain-containing protein [Oscillospiraceae bacterium]|nr:leucine-rich repeat domain-containing protein [Oscillospiraceae bacterium]